MSQENKSVVRRYVQQVLEGGDMKVMDEVLDASFICHPTGLAPTEDLETTKGSITMWRAALPDLKVAIENEIAEGEAVAVRVTIMGTHKGALGDMPASGNRVNLPAAFIFRIRNGKIIEERDFFDQGTFMQQLQTK